MGYSRQDFSSGAVFTAAQADQVEENIAAHQHGVSSVSLVPVETGLRTMIYGRINTTAPVSIVAGSYYSVVRNGTGDVTISFSKGFIETPTFAGIAREEAANSRRLIDYQTVNMSLAQVKTLSMSGTALDAEFGFMATGAGSG